ncbi:MAG TPA: nitrophenyl compound nitroreductase subunit ArsF family protein [Thermoguttaceae bacterium]|nr:nitrophenyl compound nitroreductase subunit ArsF family protein [Thermoguttaceae bacterium]
MELKNALAVCLISFFSATLVVLIVRALDSHTASQLEPQLTQIAEELQAIRKQGGIAAASEGTASRAADDALMVYYFHGQRCATCLAAESNAYDTLNTEYASQLENGEMVWKVLDYRKDPKAKDFDIVTSTIVLVRMKGGQIDAWNRLDRVLVLAEDKTALSAYLQDEINEMLKTAAPEPEPAQPGDVPAIPVPGTETDELPLPTGPAGIPVPQ